MLERRIADQELARDIYQDTFTVVLLRLRSEALDVPERLPAFVRQTAQNLAVGAFRREGRRRTHAGGDEMELVADPAGNPYTRMSGEQERSAIHRIISEMTVARDRQMLLRHYIDDVDKTTLCMELDLSAEHFDRVLHRARQRLRELLVAQGARNWSERE